MKSVKEPRSIDIFPHYTGGSRRRTIGIALLADLASLILDRFKPW